MVANLGEDGERTFANLYDKTDYESAIDIVLDVCQENALRNMKNAAKSDPLNKMVGVNILEKLKSELNTEERWNSLSNSSPKHRVHTYNLILPSEPWLYLETLEL